MDKISLIAIIGGLTAILAGQALEGGHIGSLIQVTAFMIVIGGTFSAVMLQSTPKQFLTGLRMAGWVLPGARARRAPSPGPSIRSDSIASRASGAQSRASGGIALARRVDAGSHG